MSADGFVLDAFGRPFDESVEDGDFHVVVVG